MRTKPTYADCWLIGSADELDLISEYRLPGARVTIGTSSDGETEYNLSPDEYTSADSVNALVSDVIDCVRNSYREKGGRMDRQSVLSEARGRIMDRSDTIEAVYGSNSIDIGKVIDNLCETVHRYTVGLGIFDILLSDPRLEDIYIDAPCDRNRIHVTMNGVSGINSNLRCRTNLMVDRKEIMNLINVLKRDSGLQFSESGPVLETDMKGRDARATVIGYPMSPNGEAVSIRKHSTRPWTLTRLIANGTLDHETAGLLSFLVDNRCTFLVCGARGAGKSSLLTALMFEFPVSQRILTIDDGFKHSKWLSFMSKRLEVAKQLLSREGIIFISIDDNEYAQLKILCDEIFDEENYQATFHMQVRYAEKSINEEKSFKPLMEYVLLYSKDKNFFSPKMEAEEYDLSKFNYKITELTQGEKFTVNNQEVIVFRPLEWTISEVKPSLTGLKETWITGSIYSKMSYGKVYQTVIEPRIDIDGLGCLYKVMGRGEDGLGYRYYTGPRRKNATKGKMFSGVPLERVEEIKNGGTSLKYKPILTSFDFSPDFGNIRTEGGVAFNSGKKPIKMIKQLINYHPNKDAIVLDFFAGSASTAHAVIELNKEDGGKRRYIMCTNNENNICTEKTYPRLKNVLTGWGNNAASPGNLIYLKTDYVERESDHPEYNLEKKLTAHIKEMVSLEHHSVIDGTKYVLITNDDELYQFESNDSIISCCKSVYYSSNVLLTHSFMKTINDHNIEAILIPDYYFMTELEG